MTQRIRVTERALQCYLRANRWPPSAGNIERAELQLVQILAAARHRQTDAEGRELWRAPDSAGGWRLVIARDERGDGKAVIWCGQSRPADNVWTPPEPRDETPIDPSARRTRGRPAKPDEERNQPLSVSMRPVDLARLRALRHDDETPTQTIRRLIELAHILRVEQAR